MMVSCSRNAQRFTVAGVALLCLLTSGIADAVETAAADSSQKIQSIKFEDWFYRCTAADDAGGTRRMCEVSQLAQVKRGNEQVTVLTLALTLPEQVSLERGQLQSIALTALVPLNVHIPRGLEIGVDGRDRKTLPFRNCNQAGCWAVTSLSSKDLRSLKQGQIAVAKMRLMNNQDVNIEFSLKGLTKALSKLQSQHSGDAVP